MLGIVPEHALIASETRKAAKTYYGATRHYIYLMDVGQNLIFITSYYIYFK